MSRFFGGLPKRALVVAPHADDEVLGAGGFIARAARKGWDVTVLFTTVSEQGARARGDQPHPSSRLDEAQQALQTLGAKGYRVQFMGDEHHSRLDRVPQAELVEFLEKAVKEIEPSVAVIPTYKQYSQDHHAVATACTAALRPAPCETLPYVPVVLAYGHTAPMWGELGEFRGNFHVDITEVIEKKLAALACYESQTCALPHPRSLDMVRAWCASMGAYAGVQYAESFECLRYTV